MIRLGKYSPLLVAAIIATHVVRGSDDGTLRTQEIRLKRGWNAVFLEVYPPDSEPSVVFAGTPVDMAAAHYGRATAAQFATDATIDLSKQAGWGVWYGPGRVDSFLSTLHAIYGQQSYLVHATSDFVWRITGTVVCAETIWQPDSYNFVGFAVDALSPPTFAQFFSGSSAHRHNQVYRLSEEAWRRVSDPSAERMRSGEAFWIYCNGPSKYEGPLRVETVTRKGLLLLGSQTGDVIVRNETDQPITATITHLAPAANVMPLALVVQSVGSKSGPVQSVAVPQPAGTWTHALPPLRGRRALRIPLQLRTEATSSFSQSSLVKVTTDLGTEAWIPVFGIREDQEEQ